MLRKALVNSKLRYSFWTENRRCVWAIHARTTQTGEKIVANLICQNWENAELRPFCCGSVVSKHVTE